MIILVGGEKGGTGKSTIVVNLSVILGRMGKEVLLVDTDKQATSSFWASIRDSAETQPKIICIQRFGKGLPRDVINMAGKYDEILIDAGGRDSMELRYSMGIADKMIIPVQATQFDLATLTQMDRLVERAQKLNPTLNAYVVINRASTNPSVTDTQEACELIQGFQHLALLNSILRERVSYQRSVREGLSVVEVPQPDNKAVTEINSLVEEVYGG